MRIETKSTIFLAVFIVFISLETAARVDVTFSGIVGGDIRTIYSKIHMLDKSIDSDLVWVNGDSIVFNTYLQRSVFVHEVSL